MAGSVNKVILVGNCGKDPEVRTTQDGKKIVQISLATSESWNDRASGERRERTEWHRIVVMNERIGEVAEKYVRKGSKIYVEGSIQTRKWTDQSGVERYSTEVVIGAFRGEMQLLDSRGNGDASDQSGERERGGSREAAPQRGAPAGSAGSKPNTRGVPTGPGFGQSGTQSSNDLDDEIPF